MRDMTRSIASPSRLARCAELHSAAVGVIRLFLALVVAIDHYRQIVLVPSGRSITGRYELNMNAGFAVMCFYVISGFLISTVLAKKYPPTAAATARFYRSRAIRIYSLYWPLAALAVLLLPAARTDLLSKHALDAFTTLALIGADWRVALASYPGLHFEATLWSFNQTWTLGAELLFYALAPWLLRSPWATAAAFAASGATRLYLVHRYGFHSGMTYMFLPSTFLFFLMGHLARVWADRFDWLRAPAVGAAGLTIGVALLNIGPYMTWDSPRFWMLMAAFTIAVPSVFHATHSRSWSNRTGELSYPVYLVHGLVLSLIGSSLAGSSLPIPLGAAAYLAAVLAVAAAAHYAIERPVSATLKAGFGL